MLATPEKMIFIAGIFLLAGIVKGVVGMGLPVVAMGALALIMPSVEAAVLLIVPSLITNIWQFATGPSIRKITIRLAWMMVFLCVGTALGIQLLTQKNVSWPSVALGLVLVLYALSGLAFPGLSVPSRMESRLSPVIGLITGLLTGATGVFAVPAVPYLSALGLSRDDLIQALGLSFTVSTVALAVGLGASGSVSNELVTISGLALVPAMGGVFLGTVLRERLHPKTFRRWFLISLIFVGGYMALKGLVRQ